MQVTVLELSAGKAAAVHTQSPSSQIGEVSQANELLTQLMCTVPYILARMYAMPAVSTRLAVEPC